MNVDYVVDPDGGGTHTTLESALQAAIAAAGASGEKTIWAYHFKADGGFPYVHPLATAEGTCLSALAPNDHPWHRGVWFSWKYLNGVNYWNWEGASRDGVPPGRTVPAGKETVRLEPGQAKLAMDL